MLRILRDNPELGILQNLDFVLLLSLLDELLLGIREPLSAFVVSDRVERDDHREQAEWTHSRPNPTRTLERAEVGSQRTTATV
jgi:hypothetical protein